MTARVLAALALVVGLEAAARAEVEPPAPEPLAVAPSGYAAGLFYSRHPLRKGGLEAQARVDLSRGLRWGVHAAYTADLLLETEETIELVPAPRPPPPPPPLPPPPPPPPIRRVVADDRWVLFHDVLAGGSLALVPDASLWLALEAHALLGSGGYAAGYSDGGSFFGLLGAALDASGDARIEVGGGGVWLRSDRGGTAVARPSYRLADWLDISALAFATRNAPDDPALSERRWRFGYGAEARLGPFLERVSVELRWLGGERVLALDRLGSVVENLPDLQRDALSGLVSVRVAGAAWIYAGGGLRWAEAPGDLRYTLASTFVGGSITF